MFNTKNQKGLSLITLVITIVVIIILASITFVLNKNPLNEASAVKFKQEISDVKKGVETVKLINAKKGLDEKTLNKNFKKVEVIKPPSRFVSFDEDKLTGYLVDLEEIDYKKIQTGQGYKEVNEGDSVKFGVDDVYVYDKEGTVYYLKGAYLDGNDVYYTADDKKLDGPTITAENTEGGKITIKVTPTNSGEITNVKVGEKSANKISDGIYEAEVDKNGSYIISATETGNGTSKIKIEVTKIDESTSKEATTAPTQAEIIINSGEIYTHNEEATLTINSDAQLMYIKQVTDGSIPKVPSASSSGWRNKTETTKIILSEGVNEVWVWFRNKGNNAILSARASTMLDTNPPTRTKPTVEIFDGYSFRITSNQKDTTSGIKKIEIGIKKEEEADYTWTEVADIENPTIEVLENTPNQNYLIISRAEDNSGLSSTSLEYMTGALKPIPGGIIIDYSPKEGYTARSTIVITYPEDANSTLYEKWYRIDEGEWQLAENIETTIYLEENAVIDAVVVRKTSTKTIFGEMTTAIINNIDGTSPTIGYVELNPITAEDGVDFNASVEIKDNETGVYEYAITETENMPAEWKKLTRPMQQVTITFDAYVGKTYYIWAKDEAGNIANKKEEINAIDLSDAEIKVELEETKYDYTGLEIKPKEIVTYKGYELTKGENYEVTYKNNTNAGTATATITGKGVYKGSIEKEYTILKVKPTITLENATYLYTANIQEITPAKVTGTPDGSIPSGKITYTYYKDAELTTTTQTSDGAKKEGTAPSEEGTYYVIAEIAEDTNYLAATSNIATLSIQPRAIKITFNTDGGTESEKERIVYYKKEYGTLPETTKTGYTFEGWYTENGTKIEATSKVEIMEDHTLTAKWTAYKYQIKYDGNGNTSGTTATSTHTYDISQTLTPNGYTKTGYTFTSWNTEKDGTGTTYQDCVSVKNLTTKNNDTITLYAQWIKNGYQIKYDGNGNTSGTMANSTHTYDEEKALTQNAYTKTGYTFNGWNTKKDGTGTAYKDGENVKNLTTNNGEVVVIYAQWIANKYTVKYDGNTSTSGTMENQTFTYDVAQRLTQNAYTKTGYTFTSWNTKKDGKGTSYQNNESVTNLTATNNEIITLYAIWSSEEYQITYDLNGGEIQAGILTVWCDGPTATQEQCSHGYTKRHAYTTPCPTCLGDGIYNGEKCTAGCDGLGLNPTIYTINTETFTLINPSKTGYTFTGWTGSNGTTPQTTVTIEKGSTGNRNYKANWKAKEYQITYNLNGGTVNGTNKTSYTIETNTFTLINPERKGYTFIGWTGSNGTTPQTTVTIEKGTTGEKTYEANWEIIKYKITYDLAGGEISGNPEEYTIETESITLKNPVRKGYTFTGWTGSNGTTPQTTVTIEKGSTGNKTYTANWQIDGYQITYNLAGGTVTGGTNPSTYNVTSPAITLINPERKGYTFTGWTGSNGTTPQTSVIIPNGSTGDKTYTANWQINTYTITYTLNGGTVSGTNKTSYTVETETFTLINPSKTGYTFKGWTGTDITNAQTLVTIEKGSVGNRTYEANWEIDGYKIEYELNGGTLLDTNPTTYNITTSAITLKNPVKEGYTFLGWTGTGLTEVTKNVTIPKGSTGDRKYEANWQVNKYTITFNTDGGTTVNSITQDYGTTITKPADPTKEGYTFTGWTPSLPTTMPANNLTVTATWDVNKYIVTFNANEGEIENLGTTTTTKTVTYGEAYGELPTATREKYTFEGWNTKKDGTGTTINASTIVDVTASGLILYAQWKKEVEAFAVYSETDNSLTFYKNADKLTAGETYNGKIATAVYTGVEEDVYFSDTGYEPWYSYRTNITTVKFENEINPVSTAYWFYKFSALTKIENIAKLDTSSVTNMKGMFWSCKGLTTLDVSRFDTSNVRDMSYMFAGCSSVTTLDLSKFNTSGVTDMSCIFDGCSSLATLDVSKFNTSNVTDMFRMFAECTNLTTLDLSKFNTSNVTHMDGMFYKCINITNIDVSKFNTSKVTTMFSMFSMCTSLTTLDVSNFNTSNVTSMEDMFFRCEKLTTLNLSDFDTSKVIDTSFMFQDCSSLTTLDIGNFNTSNVTDIRDMFKNMNNLQEITLGALFSFNGDGTTSCTLPTPDPNNITGADGKWYDKDTGIGYTPSEVPATRTKTETYLAVVPAEEFVIYSETDNSLTFYKNRDGAGLYEGDTYNGKTVSFICKDSFESNIYASSEIPWKSIAGNVTKVVFDGEITPTSTAYWFNGFSALTEIENIAKLDTSSVTNMNGMFWHCSSLTELDVSGFDTSNVTNMKYMFNTCRNLTTLDVSNFNTSNVTNMNGMFFWCENVTTLDVSKFNTSNVTDMNGMFHWSGVKTLNLSNFNTLNVWDMSNMFEGCSNLTALNLSSFNTSNVTYMSWMFENCVNLTELDVTSFDTSKVIDMGYMFARCSSLKVLDLTNFNTSKIEKTTSETSGMTDMFYGMNKLQEITLGDKFTFNGSGSSRQCSLPDQSNNIAGADGKWYNKSTGTAYTPETVPNNVAATYSAIPVYVVTFDANGGQIDGLGATTTTRKVVFGKTYDEGSDIVPTAVSGDDYEFLGWNTKKDGTGTTITGTTIVDATANGLTLYAQWKKEAEVFAVYSETDNSLTFYKNGDTVTAGATYNGKTATAVYTGIEVDPYTSASYVPWYEYRKNITTVTFVDEISPVSTAYWFYEAENITTLDLTNLNTSNVTDMSFMFYGCSSVTTLDVSRFNTSNVTNMSGMFCGCLSVTTLDVSGFNTSNVTNMSGMFVICGVTTLDVSRFDTSKVTDMSAMFEYCLSMTNLDLSGFDTSNVTNMSEMFYFCTEIVSLDLSRFNTSKVTDMSNMFMYMSNLKEIKLGEMFSFNGDGSTNCTLPTPDPSNIPGADGNWYDMDTLEYYAPEDVPSNKAATYTAICLVGKGFAVYSETDNSLTFYKNKDTVTSGETYNGKIATAVYAGIEKANYKIDTEVPWYNYRENITTVTFYSGDEEKISPVSTAYWFYGLKNIATIDLTNLNTSNVTNMRYMFYGCLYVPTIDVSKFDTSKVTDMQCMFGGCMVVSTLDLSKFDTSNVTNMNNMFVLCASITTLDFSRFNTSKVTDMSAMFAYCAGIINLDLSGFDTSNVTDMSAMFQGCTSLTTLDISKFNTSNVTTMEEMFYNCKSLTTLDLSSFNPLNVITMKKMFWVCEGLTELKLTSFNTQNVTTMEEMFHSCTSVTTLDLSSLNTQNVTTMEEMFYNCTSLTTLDISNFNTSSVTNMSNMFFECSGLTGLNLSHFNTSNVITMDDMFNKCSGLITLNISNFNTENATDMSRMFYYCSKLTTLDISSFNTSKANAMTAMFFGMNKLQEITLGASFNFKGNGSTSCTLPDQSTKITGSDGKWYNKSTGTAYTPANVPNNTAATYSAIPVYVVTFNANGGQIYDLGATTTTRKVTLGKTYDEGSDTVPSAVSGDDYEFLGWNTNKDGTGTTITGTTIVDATANGLTLYAQWQKAAEAFAVYSADDNSLTFYKNGDIVKGATQIFGQTAYKGDIYNGKRATAVYTEIEKGTYEKVKDVPWYDYIDDITTVTFKNEISPISTAYWFYTSSILFNSGKSQIENIENLDTSKVTNMSGMFYNCSSLEALDVSKFDTSNVIDMSSMFYNCSSLEELDVSKFDTSNVTDMSSMFEGTSLTTLDLSEFDTSKVTDMSEMFAGSSLTKLDLTNFNTSNVTNMNGMFSTCKKLITLNLSNFDTSRVTDMGNMFTHMYNIEELDISNFNTSNVTNMGGMFNSCSILNKIDVSNFDTSNVTNMCSMFACCEKLGGVNLSNWNTSNVTNMSYMFADCTRLHGLGNVNELDTSNVTNMRSMFINCEALKVDCSSWNVENVTECTGFNGSAPGVIAPAWGGEIEDEDS